MKKNIMFSILTIATILCLAGCDWCCCKTKSCDSKPTTEEKMPEKEQAKSETTLPVETKTAKETVTPMPEAPKTF